MNLSTLADTERQMALEAAQMLPPDLFDAWHNAGHTQRVGVSQGHLLVVFRWMFGEPHILEHLRVGKLILDPRDGLRTMLFGEDGDSYLIGNTPVSLMEGKIFCHVPFYATLSSKIYRERTAVGFPLVFKAEGSPLRREDTKVTLLTLPEFRKAFPQYKENTV